MGDGESRKGLGSKKLTPKGEKSRTVAAKPKILAYVCIFLGLAGVFQSIAFLPPNTDGLRGLTFLVLHVVVYLGGGLYLLVLGSKLLSAAEKEEGVSK